jgi:hypothetical protein
MSDYFIEQSQLEDVKTMQIIINIVIIFLQLLAGQLLGFGSALALGVGNGWELLVIPLGNTVGIFTVGAAALWLWQERWLRLYKFRLIGTAVGSTLGVILILITPPTGMNQLLYPLLGALLGYYLPLPLLQYYHEAK